VILKRFTEYFRAEIINTKPQDFAIKCIPLDKLFDLMLQPVVDANNELLYVECFVRFKQLQSKLPPLLFEFNESGAMLSLESTKQFTRQSKALNIEIAIEH
jgi:EAL domain-containing protein (putative c-di-GMP-specific phosphodiesterase class I)